MQPNPEGKFVYNFINKERFEEKQINRRQFLELTKQLGFFAGISYFLAACGVDVTESPQRREVSPGKSQEPTNTVQPISEPTDTVQPTSEPTSIPTDVHPKIPSSPPEPRQDGAFLMPVEDVFSIKGRGTVVTGSIMRGIIKPNDTVEIIGLREQIISTVCTAIEMFQKTLDEGIAGNNVGLLLRGVERTDVERGMVIAEPGSIKPYTRFKSDIYVLTSEEGGRNQPFFNGYRPQFYVWNGEITGNITLPENVEMVGPGEYVNLEIELIAPVALEVGTWFAIREGGVTLGYGIVTDLLE